MLLRPGRGPSDPVPRIVRASAESTVMWFIPVFGVQIGANKDNFLYTKSFSSRFPLTIITL
jgi:hypothetical protein